MNLVERKRRLARESMESAGGSPLDAASAIDLDAQDTAKDLDSMNQVDRFLVQSLINE